MGRILIVDLTYKHKLNTCTKTNHSLSFFLNSNHFYSYLAIAALSRTRTTSRHPEVFLSTSDNSVIVVNTATCDITDVDCRARISAPIVDMTFAPNGRFLASFTESAMLTVISTSFETKVLDFDTSEGSSSPPLAMKWCGEDRYVAWRGDQYNVEYGFLCLFCLLLYGMVY